MSENYCLICDGHNHQSKDCPNAVTAPDLQQRCLAKVDGDLDELNPIEGTFLYEKVNTNIRAAIRTNTALRSVIVRHGAVCKVSEGAFGYIRADGTPMQSLCGSCSESQSQPVEFPCSEMQEIAKELGIDE